MTFVGQDERPSDEGNPFCSVRQLLAIGETVGELATAIEADGIYTWDRFGRYRKYGAGSVEGKRCLNLLANEYELKMSGVRVSEAGENVEDELEEFGWAASALPTAQASTVRSSGPISSAFGERQRTTLLLIISAIVNRSGLPPERTTAAAIERYTDQNGVMVTDETIRKVLKMAEEARQRKLP